MHDSICKFMKDIANSRRSYALCECGVDPMSLPNQIAAADPASLKSYFHQGTVK
jgi:hypothetical protein